MTPPQQPGQPGNQPSGYGQTPYPPYGQSGGGGYQPNYSPAPRKNKTGLWVGLAFGLVVLITLGITGFVAPGFFLSKDDKPAAAPTAGQEAPGPTTTPASGGATTADGIAVLQSFVDKLNKQDAAGASALVCPASLGTVTQRGITRATSGAADLKLTGAGPALVENSVNAKLTGTVNGQPIPEDGFIGATNRDGTGYCIGNVLIFGLTNDE